VFDKKRSLKKIVFDLKKKFNWQIKFECFLNHPENHTIPRRIQKNPLEAFVWF
jgi:hypothetical protein